MMQRKGFTLVELVVVILILGILAGVAAPKMFTTSTKASENGLRQTLGIVRDAIELYRSENGVYPPCAIAGGSDFKLQLAPFLRGTFPKCPVGPAQNANITGQASGAITADGAPTVGWRYCVATGEFICNYTQFSSIDPSVKFSEF